MSSARPAKSSLTRHFQHLKGPPRLRVRWQNMRFYQKPRGVAARNRIKWWNIQPGDKVRVISGGLKDMELVREVLSVDKVVNRVYLKGTQRSSGDDNSGAARHTHYSNVQLLLGKFDFPPPEGSDTPVSKNVFATRIATSTPFYMKKTGFWAWSRYAAGTAPALPRPEGEERGRSKLLRIPIPWNKRPEKAVPPVGGYDTTPENALAITWQPISVGKQICFNGLQDQYLKSLHSSFNSLSIGDEASTAVPKYDESLPMEHYLEFELSNPHSRAKKQARWQEKMSDIDSLKDQYIAKELERAKQTGPGTKFGGRRVKPNEAKQIGLWKWKMEVKRAEKKVQYQRYIARGGLENEKKRHERSERKTRRQQEKLRQLVFDPKEKNQVLPPSMIA